MKKHGRVALVFMMAIVIGLLLPRLGMAGSLEPSGAPAPTMRTLDEIYSTNSWSKKLQCDIVDTIHGPRPVCPRFEVLADFNNEAVLDKETGLVWEKSPSSNTYGLQAAQYTCNGLCWLSTAGGRCAWRIPTVQELESLIDPTRFSLQGVSTLPSGNPFSNVQAHPAQYWSSTLSPWGGSQSAWSVIFSSGDPPISVGGVTNQNYVWCVRGGSGVDAQ
jgi:hypothetical protein